MTDTTDYAEQLTRTFSRNGKKGLTVDEYIYELKGEIELAAEWQNQLRHEIERLKAENKSLEKRLKLSDDAFLAVCVDTNYCAKPTP